MNASAPIPSDDGHPGQCTPSPKVSRSRRSGKARRGGVVLLLSMTGIFGILLALHTLASTTVWYTRITFLPSHPSPAIPRIPPRFAPLPVPILVSPPFSSERPFTSHVHSLPYAGTALHLGTSVHPRKLLNASRAFVSSFTHTPDSPSEESSSAQARAETEKEAGTAAIEYTLESTWYFAKNGDLSWASSEFRGMMGPEADYLRFTCLYTDTTRIGAQAHPVEVEAEWQVQVRYEYGLVRCPLPDFMGDVRDVRVGEGEGTVQQAERYLNRLQRVDVTIRAWMEVGPAGNGERGRRGVDDNSPGSLERETDSAPESTSNSKESKRATNRRVRAKLDKRIEGYIPPRPDPTSLPEWYGKPLPPASPSASDSDNDGDGDMKAPHTVRVIGNTTLLLIATHSHPSGTLSPPPPSSRSKLSICLSPITLKPDAADASVQLAKMVEWRVWHAFQGVGIVHWSFRDPAFQRWVERLNEVLEVEDTDTVSPIPLRDWEATHTGPGANARLNYADQGLYNAACLQRYGYVDEWNAFVDYDEFLLPRYDSRPLATLRRLEEVSDDVGGLYVLQTYWGGPRVGDVTEPADTDVTASFDSDTDPIQVPFVPSFPAFPRNANTRWGTLGPSYGTRWGKMIYRSAAVDTFWVHYALKWAEGFREWVDVPEQSEAQAARVSAHDAALDRLGDGTGAATYSGEEEDEMYEGYELDVEGKGQGEGEGEGEVDVPLSNLELLHGRDQMPEGLEMDLEIPDSVPRRWTTMWEQMADVLRDERLAELTVV